MPEPLTVERAAGMALTLFLIIVKPAGGPGGSEENMKNKLILLLILMLSGMVSYAQKTPVKQWREASYGGGYIEHIKYSDGSIASAGYAPCRFCHRTHICSLCQGQGYSYIGPDVGYIPCFACGQTGRCSVCNEEGYYMITTSYMNAYGNINTSRLSDFDSSSGSRGSSSSRSSKGSCGYCNGTGVDPQPCDAGRSTWKAYYNTSGSKCPHCGRYDSHMHDRCPRCNVPKY